MHSYNTGVANEAIVSSQLTFQDNDVLLNSADVSSSSSPNIDIQLLGGIKWEEPDLSELNGDHIVCDLYSPAFFTQGEHLPNVGPDAEYASERERVEGENIFLDAFERLKVEDSGRHKNNSGHHPSRMSFYQYCEYFNTFKSMPISDADVDAFPDLPSLVEPAALMFPTICAGQCMIDGCYDTQHFGTKERILRHLKTASDGSEPGRDDSCFCERDDNVLRMNVTGW